MKIMRVAAWALALIVVLAFLAWAIFNSGSKGSEVEPVATTTPTTLNAYITAYTYYDNTPPGSAIIAFTKGDGFPTLHNVAGGNGTYEDPITVAVGHVNTGGVDTPDFAPGTRFYLPNLRKYFIVEDTCGDGNTPQNGPCHRLDTPGNEAPAGAEVWLDIWIDGQASTTKAADECASAITELHTMIEDPAPDYAVVPGSVIGSKGCAEQFGDTPVKQ